MPKVNTFKIASYSDKSKKQEEPLISDTQEFIYGKVEQMLEEVLGKYERTTEEKSREI